MLTTQAPTLLYHFHRLTLPLLLLGGALAMGAGLLGRLEGRRAGPADEDAAAGKDRLGDPLPPGAIARIGSPRLRPFWTTSCLTFSPDGKILASGDEEILHLWDARTGREVRHFNARVGQLRDLAFSPDGKYLAAAGGGGNNRWMRLWEVATWKPLPHFKGQFGYTHTVAFSPDGKTLASGGYGNTIHLWDVATGRERGQLFPPGAHTEEKDGRGGFVVGSIRGQVFRVRFSPDGRTLFSHSGNRDRYLQFLQAWDLSTGKERWKARTYAEEPASPALFSPDGRLALLELKGGVKAVDLKSGKEIPSPAATPGDALVAFSPDGKELACWRADGQIRLHDVRTGRKLFQLDARFNGVPRIAFTRNGKGLASAYGVSAIRLWDAATGKDISPLCGGPDTVSALAFLPDGKTLATGSLEGRIHLWEASTGKQTRRLEGQFGEVVGLSLSSDGTVLAATDKDRILWVWDLAAGKVRRRLEKRDGWLGISPDGKLATYVDKKAAVLIDVATGKELRRIEGAGQLLAFSPDSRSLAAFAGDGAVYLWDCATGERVGSLGTPQRESRFQDSPCGLSFAADGKTAALVWVGHFKPGDVEVWDVSSGRKLPRFEQVHQKVGGWVNGTGFSADGRTLFLRVEDSERVEVCAYDLFTADEVGRLTERRRETSAIRGGYPQTLFPAPDGRLLVTMEWSRPALVWNVGRWTRRPVKPWGPSAARLAGCWSDLGEADPGKAYDAMGRLLRAPGPATGLLRERLRPVRAADPRRVRRLLADLGSDEFPVRSVASRELAGLGPQIKPLLRAALAGKPSPEARKRIEALLRAGPGSAPETRRALRGIQVLERIGSPEARAVLQALGRGADAAPETRDARAALARLTRHPAERH